MNIGVVIPNWIGDVAMATPTLRALRKWYAPPARIIGIMRPYVREVLSGTSWLDEVVLYDRRSRDRELGCLRTAGRLRRRRLEVMVLLTNSLSTAALAWMAGARRRVGYARDLRSPLLTDRLYALSGGRKWNPSSAVDAYLELAYRLGCPPESRTMELTTTPAEDALGEAAWQRLGFSEQSNVVALNTGGAYGSAKHWPTAHFAELARRIVREYPVNVLILCGPNEQQAAGEIETAAGSPHVRSLRGMPPSIGLTKGALRRCRLMITTDSGPRHLAVALGVPTISLFGPTDPRWSTTYNMGEVALVEKMPCGPCAKRVCPEGHHRCMQDLSVERVFQAVQQKLAAGDKRAA